MTLSQRLPQPKKKKETLGLKVETPTGCARAPAKKRMRSLPSDAAPGPGGSAPRDGEQRLGHQQRAQWRRGEDPRVVWCLQVGGVNLAFPGSQERKCFSLSQGSSPTGRLSFPLDVILLHRQEVLFAWLLGRLLPCGHKTTNKTNWPRS